MEARWRDLDAALARLAEKFPRAFVREKHLAHWPLMVGVYHDLAERCPALGQHERGAVLRHYTSRIMYLKGLVAGAVRVDLDGNPAGEVSAAVAKHAADRLAAALASREAMRAAAVEARAARRPEAPARPTEIAPAAALKRRPVLRIPAFRRRSGTA